MAWLSLLSALVGLVRLFVEYLSTRRLLDAGSAEAILKGMKDADAAIERAKQARESMRSELSRHPERVSDDDGFRRD